MSSGDSSSESVRAAGQPMRGKADREEREGQSWESEEGKDSQAASKHIKEREGKRCPKTGGTDSAQHWLPHLLWQHLPSTSHLPPSPGGPPASSCTPAVPKVGEEKADAEACRYQPCCLLGLCLVESHKADPPSSPLSHALFPFGVPPQHEVSF